jgi:hypothetical protein
LNPYLQNPDLLIDLVFFTRFQTSFIPNCPILLCLNPHLHDPDLRDPDLPHTDLPDPDLPHTDLPDPDLDDPVLRVPDLLESLSARSRSAD